MRNNIVTLYDGKITGMVGNEQRSGPLCGNQTSETIGSRGEEKCLSRRLVWIPAMPFTSKVIANFSCRLCEMWH